MTRRSFRRAWCALVLALASATSAQAASISVDVLATAGPWNWVNGGLNTGFQYGIGDHTAPALVDLQTLGIGGGSPVYVLMSQSSGLTSMFGGTPYVDQTGHVGLTFKDDALGSTGTVLPSNYMSGYWGVNSSDPANAQNYGVFLGALVGAFLDANGAIINNPFAVGAVFAFDDGNGGYVQAFGIGFSTSLPANARYVSFGVNDDLFADNTGSLKVCVGSNDPDVQACAQGNPTIVPNVPEPGTLGLLGLGLVAMAAARRRRPR